MSKQPCVWVVEWRATDKWRPCSRFESRKFALCELEGFREDSGQPAKFRVAKYVRAEPKKKKGRK